MKLIIILAISIVISGYSGCFAVQAAQVPSNATQLSDIINNTYKGQVEVLSESPHTLILTVSPEGGNLASTAIDIVKQSGYKIDAVTAFVPPAGASQTNYPELYTIFFSK